MERKALFSDCRTYRYALWRQWDAALEQILFIGLNPSTADASQDDPTIRRCMAFARSWGYGGFCIANLYAFCHPYPKELFKAKDPVGPDNDRHLADLMEAHDKVILIWGNDGGRTDRFKVILERTKNPLCLSKNKSGHPAHPLYLKKELKPKPYLHDYSD